MVVVVGAMKVSWRRRLPGLTPPSRNMTLKRHDSSTVVGDDRGSEGSARTSSLGARPTPRRVEGPVTLPGVCEQAEMKELKAIPA